MGRFLTPAELAELLAVPVPFAEPPLPISDTAADAGIFGPGSVTWKVMREPLLILGGGRALLMQAAHPHVAQGAIDHSAFAEDPFGRLMRTFEWAGAVAFGSTREARLASAKVNRLHRAVAGSLPRENATERVGRASPYSATDEKLLLWVHATFVDTLLVSYQGLVGGLGVHQQDRFVKEWEAVARLMGVPRRLLWPNRAALAAYVRGEIGPGGEAVPGAGSRRVARTILSPPLPSPLLSPFWRMLNFATLGFLPPELRRGYQVFWTPAHTASFWAMTTAIRGARAGMPRRLRYAPIYDFAMARVRGELEPRRRGRRAA